MKVKTNIKILTVLLIIIGAMLIFANNKVEASTFRYYITYGEITSGNLTEDIFNNLPDTISVNIKEIEFEKADDLVLEQIITELGKQNIIVQKNESSSTKPYISDISVCVNYNESIRKVTLNYLSLEKEISISYSNSNDYNETDKKLVENSLGNITFDNYRAYTSNRIYGVRKI